MDQSGAGGASNTVDLAALAEFNPALASQALAQLYADGERELALSWVGRLDPFERCKLRPGSPKAKELGFAHSWGVSLATLAVVDRDAEALARMERQREGFAKALYRDGCEELARAARAALSDDEPFARFLLGKIDPLRVDGRSPMIGLGALVDEACKLRKFDLLPRLSALSQAADGYPLRGNELAKKHFLSPPDREGCEALLDAGLLSFGPLKFTHDTSAQEIARAFVASSDAADVGFGLRLLELDHAEHLARTPALHPPTLRSIFAGSCLWAAPIDTPLPWLRFYLDRGVDPFAESTDGTCSPAARLVGFDWRARSLSRGSGAEHAAAARARREELDARVLERLAEMMRAKPGAEPLERKFDASALGAELRANLMGARKVDILTACVAQGFWRSAAAIARAGASHKAAQEQCSKRLVAGSHWDDPAIKEQAQAFFESLELKAAADRASAARDAKLAREGSAPEPPRPSIRL